MRDHSAALPIWTDAGGRGRTVLHVDAHDDMRPVLASKLSTVAGAIKAGDTARVASLGDNVNMAGSYDVGDYLSVAAETGLVDEVVWVVPWRFGSPQSAVSSVRERLADGGTAPEDIRLDWRDGAVRGTVRKTRLVAWDLTSPMSFDAPVLLDLDADFFPAYMQLRDTAGVDAVGQLIAALRDSGVRTDLVTVATSVRGRFTPLQYRWLTDLLALALQNPAAMAQRPPARFSQMSEALRLERSGDDSGAAAAWQRAMSAAPRDPSALYGSARSAALSGTVDSALALLKGATGLDAEYAQGYPHLALELAETGGTTAALRVLAAAPSGEEDHWVTYAMATVLYNAGRLDEALPLYEGLARPSQHPDPWMYLGDTLAALGRTEQAASAYRTGLRLLTDLPVKDPKDYTDALPALAAMRAEQGDKSGAREYYSLYLEREPDGRYAQKVREALSRLAP